MDNTTQQQTSLTDPTKQGLSALFNDAPDRIGSMVAEQMAGKYAHDVFGAVADGKDPSEVQLPVPPMGLPVDAARAYATKLKSEIQPKVFDIAKKDRHLIGLAKRIAFGKEDDFDRAYLHSMTPGDARALADYMRMYGAKEATISEKLGRVIGGFGEAYHKAGMTMQLMLAQAGLEEPPTTGLMQAEMLREEARPMVAPVAPDAGYAARTVRAARSTFWGFLQMVPDLIGGAMAASGGAAIGGILGGATGTAAGPGGAATGASFSAVAGSAIAETMYWGMQITPDEYQKMKLEGVDDDVAIPASIISGFTQAAFARAATATARGAVQLPLTQKAVEAVGKTRAGRFVGEAVKKAPGVVPQKAWDLIAKMSDVTRKTAIRRVGASMAKHTAKKYPKVYGDLAAMAAISEVVNAAAQAISSEGPINWEEAEKHWKASLAGIGLTAGMLTITGAAWKAGKEELSNQLWKRGMHWRQVFYRNYLLSDRGVTDAADALTLRPEGQAWVEKMKDKRREKQPPTMEDLRELGIIYAPLRKQQIIDFVARVMSKFAEVDERRRAPFGGHEPPAEIKGMADKYWAELGEVDSQLKAARHSPAMKNIQWAFSDDVPPHERAAAVYRHLASQRNLGSHEKELLKASSRGTLAAIINRLTWPAYENLGKEDMVKVASRALVFAREMPLTDALAVTLNGVEPDLSKINPAVRETLEGVLNDFARAEKIDVFSEPGEQADFDVVPRGEIGVGDRYRIGGKTFEVTEVTEDGFVAKDEAGNVHKFAAEEVVVEPGSFEKAKAEEAPPETPAEEERSVGQQQTLYHGTSIKSAADILKQQRFDLEKFGTGADINFKEGKVGLLGMGKQPGFYGKGIYFTSKPELAKVYAEARKSGKGKVLRAITSAPIFDATKKENYLGDLKEWWVKQYAPSERKRRGRPPLPEEELRDAFDVEIASSPSSLADALNKYASEKGYKGVKYSDSEIVIFDPDVIDAIESVEEEAAPQQPRPPEAPPEAKPEPPQEEAKPEKRYVSDVWDETKDRREEWVRKAGYESKKTGKITRAGKEIVGKKWSELKPNQQRALVKAMRGEDASLVPPLIPKAERAKGPIVPPEGDSMRRIVRRLLDRYGVRFKREGARESGYLDDMDKEALRRISSSFLSRSGKMGLDEINTLFKESGVPELEAIGETHTPEEIWRMIAEDYHVRPQADIEAEMEAAQADYAFGQYVDEGKMPSSMSVDDFHRWWGGEHKIIVTPATEFKSGDEFTVAGEKKKLEITNDGKWILHGEETQTFPEAPFDIAIDEGSLRRGGKPVDVKGKDLAKFLEPPSLIRVPQSELKAGDVFEINGEPAYVFQREGGGLAIRFADGYTEDIEPDAHIQIDEGTLKRNGQTVEVSGQDAEVADELDFDFPLQAMEVGQEVTPAATWTAFSRQKLPLNTRQLYDRLEQEFGVSIMRGWIPAKYAGLYGQVAMMPSGEKEFVGGMVTMNKKFWGSIRYAVHEVAHKVDDFQNIVKKAPYVIRKALGRWDYDKKKRRPAEGFAEVLAHYMVGIDVEGQDFEVGRWLKEMLAENKELGRKVESVKADIVQFVNGDPVAAAEAQFEREGAPRDLKSKILNGQMSMAESKFEDSYFYFVDKFRGLTRLDKDIAKVYGINPKNVESAKQMNRVAWMQYGSWRNYVGVAVDEGVFSIPTSKSKTRKLGPALREYIAELNTRDPKVIRDFDLWARLRHAIYMAENVFGADHAMGLPLRSAREALVRLERPEFKKAYIKWRQAWEALLDVAADPEVGAVSPEAAKILKGIVDENDPDNFDKRRYPYYVPLYASEMGAKRGKSMFRPEVIGGKRTLYRRIKGHMRPTMSINDAFRIQANRVYREAIERAFYNQLITDSVEAAKEARRKGLDFNLAKYMRPIDPDVRKVTLPRRKVVESLLESVDPVMRESAKSIFESLFPEMGDKKPADMDEAVAQILFGTSAKDAAPMVNLFMRDYYAPADQPVFLYTRGHKMQRWAITNPDFARAIKEFFRHYLDAPNVGWSVLRGANQLLRLGAIEYSVGFMARNLLRDYPNFWTNRRYSKAPLRDLLRGIILYSWFDIHKMTKGKIPIPDDIKAIMTSYQLSGASMSTYFGEDFANIRAKQKFFEENPKVASVLRFVNPLNAIMKINTIAESGPRLGEFVAGLKEQGWDRKRLAEAWKRGELPSRDVLMNSGWAAADVTVNFKRHGAFGQKINWGIPFWNAKIQAYDRMGRTIRENPWHLFVMGSMLATFTAAYWWKRKDDPDYQRAPAWQKYGYFWVSDPTGGHVYYIPRPHLLGWAFSGMVEAFLNKYWNEDPEALQEAMGAFFQSEAPWPFDGIGAAFTGKGNILDVLGMAQIVRPLYEAAVNRSMYSGKSIIPPSLRDAKISNWRKTSWRDQWLDKQIGYWLNISPAVIHHVFKGYTGGASERIGNVVGSFLEVVGAKAPTDNADIDVSGMLNPANLLSWGTLPHRSVNELSALYDETERAYNDAKMDAGGDVSRIPDDLVAKRYRVSRLWTLEKKILATSRTAKKQIQYRAALQWGEALAGIVMGRQPNQLYPDPFTAVDMPEPIAKVIETEKMKAAYALGSPTLGKPQEEYARWILGRAKLSKDDVIRYIREYAEKRGGKRTSRATTIRIQRALRRLER